LKTEIHFTGPQQLLSGAARSLDLFSSFLRSRFKTHLPFFLAHSATYSCNSMCKTCTQWRMSHLACRDMTTEQVFQLLSKAYAFGMRGYYLFGGEPLVRRDVSDILEYARKMGYVTTMNTNASLLERMADSISDNLDFIFVSLDYPNEYHDVIRGRRGSFKEAVNGMKRMLELGKTRVTIVTTISSLNFDRIEDMAQFAQRMGVGISYNAVEPTLASSYDEERTFSVVQDYGLTDRQLQSFYSKLLKLKDDGYPLMESRPVLVDLASEKPFRCHFPKIFVYVSPEGLIFPCTYDYGLPAMSLNSMSFEEYFSNQTFREHVTQAEACKVCIRTCVRMYSYSYELRVHHMLSLLKSAMILGKQG
jgi:MoaA/NifB/PqqE/SkfB family radical SAM enzyme